MTIKTIFLDRDGVINKEINYLHKIEDFEFIDGVFEACQYLQSLEYKIIVITNQSGISRGFYTKNDYQIITKWMVSQFKKNNISILDTFHCPHLPDSICNCRKPKPGMLLNAKNKYDIDMNQSWMIGDKETDILAANAAGISKTILLIDDHSKVLTESESGFFINSLKELKEVIKK